MSKQLFANRTEEILSRDAYLAAYKAKDGLAFAQYREHVLSALLSPYENRLFPTQLDALRKRFEVSLQELVSATPENVDVLLVKPSEKITSLRSGDDNGHLSLEEQRRLVQRAHFENVFERVRENVQLAVETQQRFKRPVNAANL
ncbi:11712_t:CDS:1 [Ambispora gerdemannii]|uniref:11712_t:CDS:1 n=1 Tax=Ambispora gerdemannii TaxID=144530 RepID=A0A9N9G0K0_9GLOM|nr:11712_t:CDS:1 [Ambispora gerdemannii]